jgi:hypothetical protein
LVKALFLLRHFVNDLDRFDVYGTDSLQEIDDLLLVAGIATGILLSDSELVSYKIAETFLDLGMTRNGRFPPIFRIHVNVVPSTMSFQMATGSNQFANEVNPFQISTPISF